MDYEFSTPLYFDSLEFAQAFYELVKTQGCSHVLDIFSKADHVDIDNFPKIFKFVAVSQPDGDIVRLWVETCSTPAGSTYIEIFLPVACELLAIMTNDLVRIYLSDRNGNAHLEKYLRKKLTASMHL
ncbi:hypothetical protein LCGC14_0143610 [marine sediment metagenome]|uniref:Uncharacterized protein n=1 Tax=marine sediment metagenome TaxID=412755 RepID=A0A0F9VFT2_9ZZZZ